ncbi:MAG TPA: hypothetical protein VGM85_18990, partial [Paraburkholderia sp.]
MPQRGIRPRLPVARPAKSWLASLRFQEVNEPAAEADKTISVQKGGAMETNASAGTHGHRS